MNQDIITIPKSELQAMLQATVAAAVTEVMRNVDTVSNLWTAERIAEYLGLSARHVAERLTVQPDFPKPVCLPSSGEKGRQARRWEPEDVIRWANQNKRRG